MSYHISYVLSYLSCTFGCAWPNPLAVVALKVDCLRFTWYISVSWFMSTALVPYQYHRRALPSR